MSAIIWLMSLQTQLLGSHDKSPRSRPSLSWGEMVRALWGFLDTDRKAFGIGYILLVIAYSYDLVPAVIIGKIIDFFTKYREGDSLLLFYGYAVFLGVSWSAVSIVRLVYKNKLHKFSIAAKVRARKQSFDRLLDFSLSWHSGENSGNKIQRIVSGGDSVRSLIRLGYNDGLRIVIRIASVLVLLFFLNVTLGLVLFVYAALFFGVEYFYSHKIREVSDSYNKSNENAAGVMSEGAGNVLSVKSLGAENHMKTRVSMSEDATLRLQMLRADLNSNKWRWFNLLMGLFLMLYALLMGRGFLMGVISLGSLAMFFTYYDQIRNACIDATDFTTSLVEWRSDFSRMMGLWKDVPKVRSGDSPFPTSDYSIELRDAHFTYPSGAEAVKRLNLSIDANEILGVAGHSGSGKSTLVKILLGLYELGSGSFTLGGVDYYKLKHEEMTANVSVVLQETELFNFSLRENITMMHDVPPALLAQALTISQLDELVARLPSGLDTLIGERGYMLSGGERQRLGIARAICKDPKIMILDEATSSLDSKTEKKITDALLFAYRGKKTFVVVAHRLSTLRSSDRVVVFEDGEIVEEGKFNQLSKKEGSRFAEMYKLQTEKKVAKTNTSSDGNAS